MPLTNEQSRQMIDVGHAFAGLRTTKHERREKYRYAMRWRSVQGREYLYCGQQSRGARSPENERAFDDYTFRRQALDTRIAKLKAKLADMAPVNRALKLGRVPLLPARLLRALDDEGVLGRGLIVIGTHALFGYEAAAGEQFQSDLLATTDLDLCWDASERLVLLNERGDTRSVLSILQRVDRSFDAATNYGLSASNDENFIVDLIAPTSDMPEPATGLKGDIAAAPIPETASLLADKPFSAMAIADDGLPVQVIAPQPDLFVAHKRRIAVESGRPPMQRRRDAAQADALAKVVPALKAAKAMYVEPN